MCRPVAHNDGYNADTMAPSEADKYIDSITDPLLQNELRWQKYLSSLRQGAWGDNITMQAISDMLSVTINVLSSHHPVYSVTPSNGYVSNEIFVGLIMQYHYVGLDTIQAVYIEPTQPVKTDTVVQQPELSEPLPDNQLDDATVAAGDEHRIQISGAPQASMMCVENSESFRHNIMCVAPAEGEKPVT